MPLYSFELPLAADAQKHDLGDDHEAWSKAVTTLGQLLKDIDGALPRTADWKLRVTEGDREVAQIQVTARLHNHKVPKSRGGAVAEP